MMTSFFSSRSTPRLLTVLPTVLLTALLTAACGSDETGESCDDDESPQRPVAPETAVILSQLKLESRITLGEGDQREVQNIASAVFVDTSRVKRITRSPDDQRFSMTCSGLTGAPVDQCRPPHTEDCFQVKLEIDGVAVSGVPGNIDLENRGTGTYVDTDAPDPLFGDGDFTVKVTGKQDPAYFPSYEQALTPPDPLEVKEPLVSQPIGRRDLKVCWNRGNGTVIEISIQIDRLDPGASTDTDKVICLVRDDGCHTVPVGAFDWLQLGDMGPDDRFKLSVTRQRIDVQTLDEKTATEIKGVRRVEMILPQDS